MSPSIVSGRVVATTQIPFAIRERVADVPQVPVDCFVGRFDIRDGGLASRTPVDHVLAAVDEALFPELNEGFANGAGQAGVHGEAFARPVDACAFAANLVVDSSAVFFFPLPDTPFEFAAAQLLPGQAFGCELAFHDHLGSNAGMISSGNPQASVRRACDASAQPHP